MSVDRTSNPRDDLTHHLRMFAVPTKNESFRSVEKLCSEAADEIERLRAALERADERIVTAIAHLDVADRRQATAVLDQGLSAIRQALGPADETQS
jgi:hypothetical protein